MDNVLTHNIKVAHKIYDFLLDTKAQINLIYGGAGSSKSWQIGLFLLVEKFLYEKNIGILVVRKTGPSLKRSCWALVMKWIEDYKIPAKVNKTDLTIELNGNRILFVSLDDREKLKSIEGINYVWIEEATELSEDDIKQVELRCRAHNENGLNQLYYSFNPSDWMHYLRPLTDNPPAGVAVCHTTYKDNKFLPAEYINRLENLIETDATYGKIYGKGEWAQLRGRIYEHWQPCFDWPESFDETLYGLDFGFNNPTALVQINIKDQDVYLREKLYESHLTTKDLIPRLEGLGVGTSDLIVADAAEPDRIEEIYQANYDCQPAKKGPDSVRRGIDVVRAKTVYYQQDSVNLIAEYNTYKWREDKDGNVLDEPLKYMDHCMDAVRYGLSHNVPMPGLGVLDDIKNERPEREDSSVMEPAAMLVGGGDDDDDWEDWK